LGGEFGGSGPTRDTYSGSCIIIRHRTLAYCTEIPRPEEHTYHPKTVVSATRFEPLSAIPYSEYRSNGETVATMEGNKSTEKAKLRKIPKEVPFRYFQQ
jgi:hypothetical protein